MQMAQRRFRCVLRFLGCDPLPMSFSLGIGWDTMGPTGMNIGVGEGVEEIAMIAAIAKDRRN
jgi:hypothetical protein